MFSVFAKIIQKIAHYPKAMIGLFLALALLSIYPIENLRWEIQLQDTLKGHEVEADFQTIEKAFGGLGSLTVILQSADSLKNFNFAKKLAEFFEKDSMVHYTEYMADMDFYRKNRILYASENDLDQVISMLDSIREKQIQKSNPLLVDLIEAEDSSVQGRDSVEIIQQIEAKYFLNLQQDFANPQGTIRIVDIYPKHSLSDLQANRALLGKVKRFIEEHGNGKSTYGGDHEPAGGHEASRLLFRNG